MSSARRTVIAQAILPVYLIVVTVIVFSPSDDSGFGFLDWLGEQLGEPAYVALEFTANIAMFVPFGVLVPVAFARLHWWMILALGFATTVAIELVQSALPSRYSTVSDVVANTLGVAIGLLALHYYPRAHGLGQFARPPTATKPQE